MSPMAEQPSQPDTQEPPDPMLTGIQASHTPDSPPPSPCSPPAEQDRDLVWVVLGGIAGAFPVGCAKFFGWEDSLQEMALGGIRDFMGILLLRAIVGMVLGLVGGYAGEYWRAGRFRSNLVTYWAIYWLVFWVVLAVVLNVWAMANASRYTVDPKPVPFGTRRFLLAVAGGLVFYAVVGAIFGAVGGAIKACLAKDR